MNNKKVIVLGGDGFCGWPTSLHLSDYGYEVIIVDNLSRRNIDNELSVTSLTPIASIDKRISAWNDISGHQIRFINLDVSKDYDEFLALVKSFAPDSIVHFAEQRAKLPQYDKSLSMVQYGKGEPSVPGYYSVRGEVEKAYAAIINGDDIISTLNHLNEDANAILADATAE